MNIYTARKFESRIEYLEQVALTYGLKYNDVVAMAKLLGRDEDFDGLLAMCADKAGTVIMIVE